ncbi:HAD-like domain-containing protein [Hyaloraphidium curvatum]|nr:HAD-like domain-containing protein [Hyaloraphidium curvatum]
MTSSAPSSLSTMPPPLVCLSDFDGTIITEDTLIDLVAYSPRFRAMGGKKAASAHARSIMIEVARQKLSYRGAFDMIASAIEGVEEAEGIEVMVKASKVDPTFSTFVRSLADRSIPLTILSSGFGEVIAEVMRRTLGNDLAAQLTIVASGHVVSPASEGLRWSVQHVDESEVGHDKSRHLIKLRATYTDSRAGTTLPIFVYFGDGLNDILPSRHADLVFAKAGSSLTKQCGRSAIPFREFEAFSEAHELLLSGLELVRDPTTQDELVEQWRRHVYGPDYRDRTLKLAEEYKQKTKKLKL